MSAEHMELQLLSGTRLSRLFCSRIRLLLRLDFGATVLIARGPLLCLAAWYARYARLVLFVALSKFAIFCWYGPQTASFSRLLLQ